MLRICMVSLANLKHVGHWCLVPESPGPPESRLETVWQPHFVLCLNDGTHAPLCGTLVTSLFLAWPSIICVNLLHKSLKSTWWPVGVVYRCTEVTFKRESFVILVWQHVLKHPASGDAAWIRKRFELSSSEHPNTIKTYCTYDQWLSYDDNARIDVLLILSCE